MVYVRAKHWILTSLLLLSSGLVETSASARDLSHLKPLSVPNLYDGLMLLEGSANVNKKLLDRQKRQVKQLERAAFSSKSKKLSLGIAYLKLAANLRQFEETIYRIRLGRYLDGGSKGEAPQLSHSISDGYLKKAASTMQDAAKKLRKSPKVLYYYAYSLALTNEPLAVNMFDELQTKYKNHPYAKRAYIGLGDYYFDSQQIDNATREYKRAEKLRNKGLSLYAQFKQAWAGYISAQGVGGAANINKSINEFVKLAREAKGKPGSLEERIGERLKNDLIALAADQQDPAAAKKLLASVGMNDAYAKVLERMAVVASETGNTKSAYRFYKELIEADKTNPMNPDYHIKLLDMIAATGNINAIVATLKLISKNYVAELAPWRSMVDKATLKRVDPILEDVLFSYATDLDRLGRDSNNAAASDGASQLYQTFIAAYPKSKRFLQVHLYLAQIYFDKRIYSKSANLLASVLPDAPRNGIGQELGELMVTAAQYMYDNDRKNYILPKPGEADRELNLPINKKTYTRALEAFVAKFPENQNAGAMLYAAGNVYFEFGHYEKSMELFESVIKKYSNDTYAKDASLKMLFYYSKTKDQDALDDTKKLIASTSLARQPQIRKFLASGSGNASPDSEETEVETVSEDSYDQ